jgi:hypothetical protein
MVEVFRVNKEPRNSAQMAAAILDSIRVEALSLGREILSMGRG